MKLPLLYLIAVGRIAASAAPTGREIMEIQAERHSITNESSIMQVVLIDRKGRREERTLRRLDQKQADGNLYSLTVFDAPKDVKGTALLTKEHQDGPNDQWLYFPSQRRLQRIAQTRRNAYFMGTDFTYEDMDPENVDLFDYRLLREERLGNAACHVIEAVPADPSAPRASGYGKRLLWINKDRLCTVKIEFYDRKGKLLKTQTNTAFEQVSETAWRPNRSAMDNRAKHHKTEVEVLSRDVATELQSETFTERHITTGRYME